VLARTTSTLGAALALVAAASLGGCGGDPKPKPVALRVTAPLDSAVVHDRMLLVHGRVRPAGARVLVAGRRASVSGRDFEATVPLRSGSNLVDVGASAPGARTTWAAVRVTRRIGVRLPDLVGASRGDAEDRIHALRLRSDVTEHKSFLDVIDPSGWQVCETAPRGGAELPKGALVRVLVSKRC
jgi:Glucodextranase, domain B/PASTA domain